MWSSSLDRRTNISSCSGLSKIYLVMWAIISSLLLWLHLGPHNSFRLRELYWGNYTTTHRCLDQPMLFNLNEESSVTATLSSWKRLPCAIEELYFIYKWPIKRKVHDCQYISIHFGFMIQLSSSVKFYCALAWNLVRLSTQERCSQLPYYTEIFTHHHRTSSHRAYGPL